MKEIVLAPESVVLAVTVLGLSVGAWLVDGALGGVLLWCSGLTTGFWVAFTAGLYQERAEREAVQEWVERNRGTETEGFDG